MTDRAGEAYVRRYNQALKRLLTAKSGEPLHELSPEMGANITLEHDRPEWHALLDQVDWSTGAVQVAAAAANVGHIEVFNPVSSGLLVVVDTAIVLIPAASTYELQLDPAAAGTPTKNFPVDTRVKTAASQNRIANNVAGLSGVNIAEVQGVVGAQYAAFVFKPVILLPGHHLAIQDATVNQILRAIMMGYERPLEVEEQSV